MYMTDDARNLYIFGGTTAILSGLMLIFLAYWFTFGSDRLPEAMHGVGVLLTILVVPTVIATTILIFKDARTGALLGLAFATLWIITELLAHTLQTAPMKQLNELLPASTTPEAESALRLVWLDLVEALTLISGFLFSVSAVFYGVSIRKWGNTISSNLFFLSAIVYVFTFIPFEDFNWHILIRGITLLFLGGVLFQAPSTTSEEVWDS